VGREEKRQKKSESMSPRDPKGELLESLINWGRYADKPEVARKNRVREGQKLCGSSTVRPTLPLAGSKDERVGSLQREKMRRKYKNGKQRGGGR